MILMTVALMNLKALKMQLHKVLICFITKGENEVEFFINFDFNKTI